MCEKMSAVLSENMNYLNDQLKVNQNFDVVYRVIRIGGREACMYFIDGFCKDELMQKMLQYFMDMKEEDLPENAHEMSKKKIPYVEVDLNSEWKEIIYFILSGVFALFIDGYEECLLIDSRSYPARSVSEPEKDKTLRGSKDGFVETVVFNTALIRRRIRSTDLRMEIMKAGKSSQTDIVLCYMNDRVDHDFLNDIKNKISHIHADALTMNQESLAECLYKKRWINPFPKFKFTERPDTAAAQILEGDVVILVDNSPSAMITPTSVFDVIEEADDYYFPPITGTYLRIARMIIAILTYFWTPTFLLLMQYPQWIPHGFEFIAVQGDINIPLNSEVMLYMAFVAIASYSQASYELGYAVKFMRMINLVMTAIFGVFGYITAVIFCVVVLFSNQTIAKKSYMYPLFPFNGRALSRVLFRHRLPGSR